MALGRMETVIQAVHPPGRLRSPWPMQRNRWSRATGLTAKASSDGQCASELPPSKGNRVAPSQFLNAGSKLKLEAERHRRFVITGRASGTSIEAIVGPGQSITVTAGNEALRIDAFDAEPEGRDPDTIEFSMTE